MNSTLENKLIKAMKRLDLMNSKILVAVSGGPDSLSLLISLNKLGFNIEAACIDHGFRLESSSEVLLVESYCKQLNIPFHTRKLSIKNKSGFEAAARTHRYSALEDIRINNSLDVIATGHTASDQAETVLMRLSKGSSLLGASGILEKRNDMVVRPFLEVTRQETCAYIKATGLKVVNDPMNNDLSFTRVKIRHEVIPKLISAIGSNTELAIARFAKLAHEDDMLLNELASNAYAQVFLDNNSLDKNAMMSLQRPLQRRVLVMYFTHMAIPVNSALIDNCLESISKEGCSTLPHNLLLITKSGKVYVKQSPSHKSRNQ
jgi:tRNA(Ile)-lysidine synthase